eukprot:scaffold105177_cov35-Tisochrysis_lutea.AAC.4
MDLKLRRFSDCCRLSADMHTSSSSDRLHPGDEKKDYITGAFAAEVPSNEEYREPTSLLAGRDDAFLKAVTALLGGGLRFVCMPSGPKLCVKPAR